jgi:hypothetical protein
MRTPAGKECRYYYEDFNRGRNTQTCRLIERNRESPPWKPGLCQTCPVPEMLRANACPNLVLDAHVSKRLLGLVQRVEVSGWCSKHFLEVDDPAVGCGHCHEEQDRPSIFDLLNQDTSGEE